MSWQMWAIIVALCILAIGLVACMVIWPATTKICIVVMMIADAWRH